MTIRRNNPNPQIVRQDGSTPRQDTRAAGAASMAARIDTVQHRIIDAIQGLLDSLSSRSNFARETTDDGLPLTESRRRIAHILRLPRICARAKCQHAGAYRGDPMQCLIVALPVMPPEVVAALKLGQRKTRRGRAR